MTRILAELRQQWAVSENEVLVRLRRLVSHGLVDEVQSLRFAVADAGRAAHPVR